MSIVDIKDNINKSDINVIKLIDIDTITNIINTYYCRDKTGEGLYSHNVSTNMINLLVNHSLKGTNHTELDLIRALFEKNIENTNLVNILSKILFIDIIKFNIYDYNNESLYNELVNNYNNELLSNYRYILLEKGFMCKSGGHKIAFLLEYDVVEQQVCILKKIIILNSGYGSGRYNIMHKNNNVDYVNCAYEILIDYTLEPLINHISNIIQIIYTITTFDYIYIYLSQYSSNRELIMNLINKKEIDVINVIIQSNDFKYSQESLRTSDVNKFLFKSQTIGDCAIRPFILSL